MGVNLAIQPGDTKEEKSGVILELSRRLAVRHRAPEKAYDRLFGTQAPHAILERLSHMNSRVLIGEYKERIFRLLGSIGSDAYDDSYYLEGHQIQYIDDWSDGTILLRWEKHTDKPNPHHLIPRSRGGTSHPKNLWQADRRVHDDIHTIFHNLTPYEQFYLILNFHKNIFSRDFTHEVRTILDREFIEPDGYIPGTFTRKKFLR